AGWHLLRYWKRNQPTARGYEIKRVAKRGQSYHWLESVGRNPPGGDRARLLHHLDRSGSNQSGYDTDWDREQVLSRQEVIDMSLTLGLLPAPRSVNGVAGLVTTG